MPWKIVENDQACPVSRPWGVRKDDAENELEGCHASESDAEKQMAALYAAEEGAVEEEDNGRSEIVNIDDVNQADDGRSEIVNIDDVVRPSFRRHPVDNLLRASADEGSASIGDGNRLFGHFAVFDSWTEIDSAREGRFLERIAPGAFASTFENRADSVRVLYDHGTDPQIGNKPLGVPVSLVEDKRGAYYEVELFDTSYVNDLKPALQAGQLGSSFRFRVVDEDWSSPTRASSHNPDRLEERTIKAVDLFEFGPVTFPAYADATAGLRSRTDEFYEMLSDPTFVVRLTDRLGPKIVEQMIAGVTADGFTSRTQTSTESGDANQVESTKPSGKLLAVALTEISRRRS